MNRPAGQSLADLATLQADIAAMEADNSLQSEENFAARAQALDYMESDVADRIEYLLRLHGHRPELPDLMQRTELLRRQLQALDDRLFERLRHEISAREISGPHLRKLMLEIAGGGLDQKPLNEPGYDTLDDFTGRLLVTHPPPREARTREADMVFYQPTPTRVLLEIMERVDFEQEDVFYDIGSGLGRVTILLHLLSGVRTIGLEVEPAFCDYARRCAASLNLRRVQFINQDARRADYSEGTVFFLYTPFKGQMLEQVLQRLRDRSHDRPLTLCTYGPCTRQAVRQEWLVHKGDAHCEVYRLAIFTSTGMG